MYELLLNKKIYVEIILLINRIITNKHNNVLNHKDFYHLFNLMILFWVKIIVASHTNEFSKDSTFMIIL